MKNHFVARILLQCSLGALMALAVSAAPVPSPEPVVIGEKFQIESKVLGEARSYVIHTPHYYNNGQIAYPVLVLLDAENNFAYVSDAVHLLSANGRIPAMIVVGINNTDRVRDMTPTKSATGFGGAAWNGSAGGADKFLAFIADELLPTIDRNYRTRPYRALIGDSLGLLSIKTVFPKPGGRVWYDAQREIHRQIYSGVEIMNTRSCETDPSRIGLATGRSQRDRAAAARFREGSRARAPDSPCRASTWKYEWPGQTKEHRLSLRFERFRAAY